MLFLLNDNGGPSDYTASTYDLEFVDHLAAKSGLSSLDCFLWMLGRDPIAGGSGTLSGYAQTHIMDHTNGKTAWTMPAVVALALCTAVPDSSKTGATITEAGYTGYGRQAIAGAGFNAASVGGAGVASTATNNGVITFAACTASSSTITGWGLCDSASTAAGNLLWWGSATSTVISTTQTPATVANAGISESLL